MIEADVKAAIRLAVGKHAPHVRLFNNPVGLAWQGRLLLQGGGRLVLEHPRRVSYGLQPGSGDLIGWSTVTVTPEMVGQRLAVFVSAEVKHKSATAGDQTQWRDVVRAAGGFADIVRSPEDALRLVAGQ